MKNTKYLIPKTISGIRVPKTLRKSTDSIKADLVWKTGVAALLLTTVYLAMKEARKGSSTRKIMGYLARPGSPAREFGALMLGQALDAAMAQWSGPKEKGLSGTKRPKRSSRSKKRRPPAKIGKKTVKKTAVREARAVRAENAAAVSRPEDSLLSPFPSHNVRNGMLGTAGS